MKFFEVEDEVELALTREGLRKIMQRGVDSLYGGSYGFIDPRPEIKSYELYDFKDDFVITLRLGKRENVNVARKK